jgi:hypothetical protein
MSVSRGPTNPIRLPGLQMKKVPTRPGKEEEEKVSPLSLFSTLFIP